MRPHGLLRIQVNVRPLDAVCPDRQHRHVERAVCVADARERRGVAGVAAEIHAVAPDSGFPAITHEHHSVGLRRRPRPEKCRDSVQVSARSPIRWDSSQSSSTIRSSGTPQPQQVGADAERHDERRSLRAHELADGGHVEVVVVIVGDDDRVQLREPVDRVRDGMHAGRTRPSGTVRRVVAPHGIGEHIPAIHLDERRRVAEPGDRESPSARGFGGSVSTGTRPGGLPCPRCRHRSGSIDSP